METETYLLIRKSKTYLNRSSTLTCWKLNSLLLSFYINTLDLKVNHHSEVSLYFWYFLSVTWQD